MYLYFIYSASCLTCSLCLHDPLDIDHLEITILVGWALNINN